MDNLAAKTEFMKAENITIRCRKEKNRSRVILLVLSFILIIWLALSYAPILIHSGSSLWQALIGPLALVFLAADLVLCLTCSRKKNTRR